MKGIIELEASPLKKKRGQTAAGEKGAQENQEATRIKKKVQTADEEKSTEESQEASPEKKKRSQTAAREKCTEEIPENSSTNIGGKKPENVNKIIKLNDMMAFANIPISTLEDQPTSSPAKNSPHLKSKTPKRTPNKTPMNTEKKKTVTPVKTVRSSTPKKTPTKQKKGRCLSNALFEGLSVLSDSPEGPTCPNKTPMNTEKKKTVTPVKTVRSSTPKKTPTKQKKDRCLSNALFEGLSVLSDPPEGPTYPSLYPSPVLELTNTGTYEDYCGYNSYHDLNKTPQPEPQCEYSSSSCNYSDPDTNSLIQYNSEMESSIRSSSEKADNLNDTFSSVTEYFGQLTHSEKNAVVGTFERLVTALKGSRSTDQSTGCTASSTSTRVVEKRMVPLITDPKDSDRYSQVTINPAELRAAESKAAASKKPAVYLLNKILEMIFTREDLVNSKGVSALHPTKMEAIQDYMFVKCKTNEWDNVTRSSFMTIIQNKIGNMRYKLKTKK